MNCTQPWYSTSYISSREGGKKCGGAPGQTFPTPWGLTGTIWTLNAGEASVRNLAVFLFLPPWQEPKRWTKELGSPRFPGSWRNCPSWEQRSLCLGMETQWWISKCHAWYVWSLVSPTDLDPYRLSCSGSGVAGILAIADCSWHKNSVLVMQ